jgi:hypothetical protein
MEIIVSRSQMAESHGTERMQIGIIDNSATTAEREFLYLVWLNWKVAYSFWSRRLERGALGYSDSGFAMA